MEAEQKSLWRRIQRILEVKRKREQALKLEVARMERSMARVEHRAGMARRARQAAMRALRRSRLQKGARFHPSHADYLQELGSRIERCKHQKQRLRESKQRAVGKLQDAMRSRKLLEKHGERLATELRASIEESEQKAMDGHSIRRFVREGDPK